MTTFKRKSYFSYDEKLTKEKIYMSELPYGKWTLEDGTQVLFNRFYENIAAKTADGEIIAFHPDFWHMDIVKTEYYYMGTPTLEKSTLRNICEIKHDFLRPELEDEAWPEKNPYEE